MIAACGAEVAPQLGRDDPWGPAEDPVQWAPTDVPIGRHNSQVQGRPRPDPAHVGLRDSLRRDLLVV